MKTNKYFNLTRFGRVLQADLLMNWKRYVYFTVGFSVVFYLLVYLMMNNNGNISNSDHFGYAIIALLCLGAFIGSALPEFSNKLRTANYLQLPGSTLEKFLSQVLVYFVLGIALLLLIFYLDVNLARWTILQQERHPEIDILSYKKLWDHAINSFFWGRNEHSSIIKTVILISSAISIGAFLFAVRLYFKKFALVKSLLCLLAGFFLYMSILVLASHIFMPEATEGFSIQLPDYQTGEDFTNVTILFFVTIGLSWLFFFPLAYFKLKEKRV